MQIKVYYFLKRKFFYPGQLKTYDLAQASSHLTFCPLLKPQNITIHNQSASYILIGPYPMDLKLCLKPTCIRDYIITCLHTHHNHVCIVNIIMFA